jgi:hypothetical protein
MDIFPAFFGMMGSFITIIFFATVWFWMRYNEIENVEMKKIAKLRLTGYSLLVMASWFACGVFSIPSYMLRPDKANVDFAVPIVYVAMILFTLGFLFLLLSERKAFLAKKHG